MFNRNAIPFLVIIIITLAVLAFFAYSIFRPNPEVQSTLTNQSTENSSSLSEQTDEQGQVTVKVKPLNIQQNSNVWEFEVTLDTHSVELDTDLAKDAVLIVNGTEYPARSWTGDPPGGHHRKGVLAFQSLSEANVVQLKIRGIGGVAERVFEWTR